MNQKEREIKSKLRLDINRSLLSICITVFTLVVSLKPSVFIKSTIAPLELTVAIPLFFSSIFARSKLAHTKRPHMWEEYGFYTFLLGYAFLINVLGIILSISVGTSLGITFLCMNIVISLVYSTLEVIEERGKLTSRIKKDLCFGLLVFLGGIVPVLFLS